MIDLSKLEGFDWDKGNITKNKKGHNVDKSESEQIFFNKPLVLLPDPKHSKPEKRFGALGVSDKKRRLAIYFTIRNKKIRVISARDQSKKERQFYQAVEKKWKELNER